jgi:hypothetical protein
MTENTIADHLNQVLKIEKRLETETIQLFPKTTGFYGQKDFKSI